MSHIPLATPANAVPLNLRLDPHGRIEEDVPCRKCGYNLRSLLPDGRCPECGTAVGRSIRGDYLRFCDPQWVGQLASGMNWIVAAIVIGFFVGLCGGIGVGFMGAGRSYMQLASFALGIIPLVGYWKVTTPDPAQLEESSGLTARRLVRATAVVNFGLSGLAVLPALAVFFWTMAIGAVGQIVGIVGLFAIFIYARTLAVRIPNDKLVRHCRIVMWGLVIAAALSITVGVVTFVMMSRTAGFAPLMMPASAPASAPAGGVVIMTASAPALGGPMAPPPAALPGFAMIGCIAMPLALCYLVFGIWSLVLLLRFRRAFQDAAGLALATWAAEAQTLPPVS